MFKFDVPKLVENFAVIIQICNRNFDRGSLKYISSSETPSMTEND